MEMYFAANNIDATVIITPTHHGEKKEYRFDGKKVSHVKILNFDSKLDIQNLENNENLTELLIDGDPEFDIENTGKIIQHVNKLVVNNELKPVYNYQEIDVLMQPNGEIKTRPHKQSKRNILEKLPVITSDDMKRVKKVSAVVYFNRRNEEGKDIALWAHENLLPWVPRPKPSDLKGVPVATKKFTGPKYLENAFNIRKMEYKRALQNISKLPDLESDIKALSRVMQRRRTHYEVDVVELVRSKLTSLGLNVGMKEGITKSSNLSRGQTIRGGAF